MIHKSSTARNWRHPWQVVREFDNGVVMVVSSHRTKLIALLCAYARNVFDRRPDRACDVRLTPEVVR
jgi:hypothetical protein